MTRLRHLKAGCLRRTTFAALSGCFALLATAAAPSPALAVSTCAANGLTVTPLQSSTFYIDTATNYLGSYVGYRVTNNGSTSRSGLWQQLESFTGGVLTPAAAGSTTRPVALDPLAAGAATPSYAYLKATAATTTAQGYDVVVYDGRPGAGATEVCRETQTVVGVQDVIKAAANKVDSASISSASATLGATFDLTVTGSTGTIGAGIAADPGVVRFSPAVAALWPSSAFRLIGVTHRIPSTAAPTADRLSVSNLSGPDRQYTITYKFRVVGTTTSPTPVTPVQNIASGTQVKHTDPSSLSALAPIPPVTSNATMSVAAPGGGSYASGTPVQLSTTLTNAGSSAITVDEVVLKLPPTWTYAPGTATRGGTSIANPYDAGGGELHLVGPYTIPANSSVPFGVTAAAGTPGSTGPFTATATLAGGQIDATADPSDNRPASTTLSVFGPPVAQDDTLSAATGGATVLNVEANDNAANGNGTLTVVTPPTSGTATVNADGRIEYVPDPGYTGPDSLQYRLTTPAGWDEATVNLTVAPPPAPPAASPHTSTGVGTNPQVERVSFPSDGSVRLLDASRNPVTSVTVSGKGTYTLDPATGDITFVPVLGFDGTATPVEFRVYDAFGQSGDSTYTPTVTRPPGPTPADKTSTGTGTVLQSAELDTVAGGRVRLLEGATEKTTLTVAGRGTYSLNVSTGRVTFAPQVGFTGAAPITYRVTDAYGQPANATYTPTVSTPNPPNPGPETSTGIGTAEHLVTLPVPAGGDVRLMNGSTPVTSLTVASEGTYRLDPATGDVRFAPVLGFAATATPITYRVTDAYHQSATAVYTPSVTRPPAPAPAPETSTGVGTARQTVELPGPVGSQVELLDGNTPTLTLDIPREGTYTVRPGSREVSFVAALGYSGVATPVRYRITDAYGQVATATYTPTVLKPDAPPAAPAATTGTAGRAQTQTIEIPAGGSATLLDADGRPTITVEVAGVGAYRLDPATGVITFTPLSSFTGTPAGVRYRVLDAYGQHRDATYVPTVVAVTFVAPAPAADEPETCVSRRTIVIHWKVAGSAGVRSQTLRVAGKPSRRLAAKARKALVDMKGLPQQRVKVIVTAHLRGGGRLQAKRVYRTCRKRSSRPPLRTLRLRPAK